MSNVIDVVSLQTPFGEIKANININYTESEVTVSLIYNGKKFSGKGADYLWVDSFLDLQEQLPDNVKLKCCLACKHGNMCPVGDFRNEVFCTKEVLIKDKSDLFFYTEDDEERKKRSRKYTDVCKDFEFQSEIFFTYSDWLYELNK